MKRVILLAVIQAVVLFFIIGALAYAFKGDFFYNYLAVVFAPIAGVLRFGQLTQRRLSCLERQLKLLKNVKQAKIQIKESDEVHRIFVWTLIFRDFT